MMNTHSFLRVSASLLGAVLLALPSQAQCTFDDWLEDNDTCATAIPAVFGLQNVLWCSSNDDDFYTVVVAPGSTLTVEIEFTNSLGDLDLFLYDDPGTCASTIASGISGTDDELVTTTNTTLVDKTYSFKVEVFGSGCNDYSLSVMMSIIPAPCPGNDVFEPNNLCAAPTPVVDGVYAQLAEPLMGGGDIYSAIVPQGYMITFRTLSTNGVAGVDFPALFLYDAACTMPALAFDASQPSQQVSYVNPTGGDVEVRAQFIYSVGTAPCIDYVLFVDIDLMVCPDDVFEENDSCATATPIAPGSYSGLTAGESGIDEDWYSIDVPHGEFVDLAVLFSHAGGNITLQIYDSSCQFIAFSDSSTDDEMLSYSNSTGVTQKIHFLVAITAGSDCNEYALEIMTGDLPGCANSADDGLEDNDDCASAVPIGEGSTPDLVLLAGDDDFYTIDVPDCYAIRATAFFSHAQADIDLRLWDDPTCGLAGLPVATSTTVTDDEELTWGNNTGGTVSVYLEVDDEFVTACGDYELLIELIPGGPGVNDDAFEDNDDCAGATPLPLGMTLDLFIASADEDFYSITLQDGETIEASIFFTHADGDLDLYFTEAANPDCGSSLMSDDYLVRGFSGSDDEMISWTNTSGGAVNYILWIDWFSSVNIGCSTYDMLIKIFEDGRIGSRICFGETNSTGVGAHMYGVGSDLVADNSLGLICEDLPLMSSGYFLNSPDPPFLVPNPGGSNGNLCIASFSQGRHLPPILNSGATGEVALLVNLTALPQPSGPATVTAGETWYWQYWYRDTDGSGNAKSNFSDAICVTFQ